MELENALLRELDAAVARLVEAEPVVVRGEWSTSLRKTYGSESQLGSGSGPYVEIEDRRWNGTLSCDGQVGGMSFLVTPECVHWAKGSVIAPSLSAVVALQGYASYRADRATLSAGIAGSGLPSIPVAVAGRQIETCVLAPSRFSTGRVTPIARIEAATFAVVLFPRTVLKMGRNHLWRMRDEVAARLPARIRELFTRRRGGTLSNAEPWA